MGARALALPLRKGQTMEVDFTPGPATSIYWAASDPTGVWFEAEVSLKKKLTVESSGDLKTAQNLINLLSAARSLNPGFLSVAGIYSVNNKLDFNREWGWGSSSTLISNVAMWAEVDPFELNRMISLGSGYDIACARSEHALLYRLREHIPEMEETVFHPDFHEHIAFIYLGKKQSTSDEINRFNPDAEFLSSRIAEISRISEQMAVSATLEQFNNLVDRHESIIGKLLNHLPIKEQLFPDFEGSVKSLGAWGGDFIMASSVNDYLKTIRYFNKKGYYVAFSWNEIIS